VWRAATEPSAMGQGLRINAPREPAATHASDAIQVVIGPKWGFREVSELFDS
jgi:hypothetical protein